MIYKIPAPGNRFITALGVFLFCVALPLKADVPDIPPPPVRLPNGTAVSGPVLAVVLLGLVLLTAGIFYILHTKYSRTSHETEVTAAPAAAAAPSPAQIANIVSLALLTVLLPELARCTI